MTQAAKHPTGDPASQQGIRAALGKAFDLGANPLLIDAAADAAFASSIERLRRSPGSHKGGKHD